MSGEPVYVADLSDLEGIKWSVHQAINNGCPVIDTPSVGKFGKWAVLRHAGVASVASFEKACSCWTIQKNHGSFTFGLVRKISPRGWESEPHSPAVISDNLPLDVVSDEIAGKIYAAYNTAA